MRGRLMGILSLGAMLALPVSAQEVTSFTLANGLQTVVIEDHRAPVVVQMLWYRIGAADEEPGKSGIAHFLEHLMFKGTANMAPGEFSATVEAQGGNDNAFTSWDFTAYFQRVASDRLELMMKMEADRMRGLILPEAEVLTERDVIIEERNQRVDSDPGGLFGEQRRAAQYLNHPYGLPIIGWRHEIAELTREDALAVYRKWYAPDNATLVIAGDVDPEEVRQLVETYYGPIPASGNLPPRIRPSEPPQLAERRLTMSDPRVAQPYMVRSYLAAHRQAGDQKEAAALTILAELLGGNGTTSVLAKALQFGADAKALHTSAYYDGDALDSGTFTLAILPAPEVPLSEAEAAMDAVIANFLAEGVDEEAFTRVKNQLRAADIYARDDVQGLANRYGAALSVGLTLEDVAAWPEVLQEVTAVDVMAAANRVFDRRRAVTGYLERPSVQPLDAEVLDVSIQAPEADVAAEAPAADADAAPVSEGEGEQK